MSSDWYQSFQNDIEQGFLPPPFRKSKIGYFFDLGDIDRGVSNPEDFYQRTRPSSPQSNQLDWTDGLYQNSVVWLTWEALVMDLLLSVLDKRQQTDPKTIVFIGIMRKLFDSGRWTDFFAVLAGLAAYRNYDRITFENLYSLLPSWSYNSSNARRRRRRHYRRGTTNRRH